MKTKHSFEPACRLGYLKLKTDLIPFFNIVTSLKLTYCVTLCHNNTTCVLVQFMGVTLTHHTLGQRAAFFANNNQKKVFHSQTTMKLRCLVFLIFLYFLNFQTLIIFACFFLDDTKFMGVTLGTILTVLVWCYLLYEGLVL